MYHVICIRNEKPLAQGKGFKPFKTVRAAERYCEVLNAYAAKYAPVLFAANRTTVRYVVEVH